MSYQRIPDELKARRQWVSAGTDKRPLNPRTQRPASVTDPATWGTFEDALKANLLHGRGIGFVLTKQDPYFLIDLDSPLPEEIAQHERIMENFLTYSEVSQSGNGLHILGKGEVPRGIRKNHVEIYSSERYVIMTGNVCNDLPLTDQQPLLDALFAEMVRASGEAAQVPEDPDQTRTDEEVIDSGHSLSNADKFGALWEGDFSAYPSQSEADYAFLSMLVYHKATNEQARRLFRLSGLGQRPKAQRDKYLDDALDKIRANEPPPVDFSALLDPPKPPSPPPPKPPAPPHKGKATPPPSPIRFPPGLVGEIAQHVFDTSIRPVRETALAVGIALAAGIAGQAYNTNTHAGLAQYVMILAETGTGKEGMNAAISRLASAVKDRSQVSIEQFIGPAVFSSGQALLRRLEKQSCFVSVLGEFGLTLKNICDPRASSADRMLLRSLLALYGMSGSKQVLAETVYSDSEKNTAQIRSPNVTILCETTPLILDSFSQEAMAGGLVPRFLFVHYTGGRPARNRNPFRPPPLSLVTKLEQLAIIALSAQADGSCRVVPTTPEAEAILDAFDEQCDARHATAQTELSKHLWTRAHLKALKLASLVAVGCDLQNPMVTVEHAKWAVEMALRDAAGLEKKVDDGETGGGDRRQEADLRRAVADFLTMSPVQRSKYKVSGELEKGEVIPYGYLRRRLLPLAAFSQDRRGGDEALKRLLESLARADVLRVVSILDAQAKFGVRTPVYLRGDQF